MAWLLQPMKAYQYWRGVSIFNNGAAASGWRGAWRNGIISPSAGENKRHQ
jgi:hypothetical protein